MLSFTTTDLDVTRSLNMVNLIPETSDHLSSGTLVTCSCRTPSSRCPRQNARMQAYLFVSTVVEILNDNVTNAAVDHSRYSTT